MYVYEENTIKYIKLSIYHVYVYDAFKYQMNKIGNINTQQFLYTQR